MLGINLTLIQHKRQDRHNDTIFIFGDRLTCFYIKTRQNDNIYMFFVVI